MNKKELARAQLMSTFMGAVYTMLWVVLLGTTHSYVLAFSGAGLYVLVLEYTTIKQALGY